MICSFCGKTEMEVQVLIAGPAVCICDECLSICQDLVNAALVVKDFHRRK
mgnify:CR=1 FL=1